MDIINLIFIFRQGICMIISPTLGFLFVKIPKTGSSSLEAALNPFMAPGDFVTPLQDYLHLFTNGTTPWETNPILLARALAKSTIQFGIERTAKSILHDLQFAHEPRLTSTYFWKYYHHITLRKIEKKLDENLYKKCLKVAMARNPLTRIMSAFRYRIAKEKRNNLNFLDWYSQEQFNFPQMVTYIEDSQGFNMDLIIRYEELDQGITKLSNMLGLKDKYLLQSFKDISIHANQDRTKVQFIQSLKNAALIENVIRKDYSDDFEYFGYK